jgi:hypothetical protein
VAVNPNAPKKNTINGYRKDVNLEAAVLLEGGLGLLAMFIRRREALVRPLAFLNPSTEIITR